LKKRTTWALAALASLGLAAAPALATGAEDDDKSVTEEVLDILKEQGTIDQQRYDELKREAAGLWSALENDPVVKMPADFVMIARVFGGLGGLMTHHTPNIDIARHVLPVLMAASMPTAN